MAKHYNSRVRHRDSQFGDLILRKVTGATRDLSQGKLGPYRITSWQRKDTYHLETLNGQKLHHPWNSEHLKKYYQQTTACRPLLISIFISFQLFLLSTVLFSPKGSHLFFLEQFLAYICVYHNKRSYSDISCTYIRLYKTTSTTKSLSGQVPPRDALQFIKVHQWTGASKGYLVIY